MRNKLFTVYDKDNESIIIEIEMPTISLEQIEEVVRVIRGLIPKG